MTCIDIDCVDGIGGDEVAQTWRRMYPEALRLFSVGQMVRSIQATLGLGRAIRRLRIFAHGTPGVQGLGASIDGLKAIPDYRRITLQTAQANRPILEELSGRFEAERDRSGWVELHGCSVGAGQEGIDLAVFLSGLWRVNVAAGTGPQITNPGFEGHYIVAHPNGTTETKVGTRVRTLGV